MTRFFAHFLFLLASWTLVIKFLMPVIWATVEGVPITTYIFWDLWWVVHLWLGWCLITKQKFVWHAAIIVSLIEIVIVVTKFWLFLSEPQWTIWTMNWFVNKVFVLSCFILLISHALLCKKSYQA